MSIEYKFRNLEPSDAIKTYAADKLSKLQKYLRAPLEAHVTFSIERHLQCVDVTCSSAGEHYQGRAEQEDLYASIDLVVDRILRQLIRSKGQHESHRRDPHPDESPGE
jgi:putative sigma-54 modulation protein